MSQAGKYREIVTFYQPGPLVQNTSGGFVEGAETSFTAWAKVETLAAKENLENGRLTYKQPYKIIIRYVKTVNQIDRVEWNGVKITINSVTHDARRTEKTLLGYATN